MLQRLRLLLDSIKFAHSVFALPFALVAMFVAADGWPSPALLMLILLCMVSARSAAMAFNRLVDRRIDTLNPRTAGRPTASGAVSPKFLVLFILACTAVFWAATYFMNAICFACALPVLAVLLGYSYSKYFTSLCHFWLGLALGLAPIGAHLAVKGNLEPLPALALNWSLGVEIFPILLSAIVILWVAGFDIIYACQDYAVDCANPQLHSIPKRVGIRNALLISAALHLLALLLLIALGTYASMGHWYYAALVLIAALLVYEHWIVRPDDLSRVNVAFFTLNGMVSLLLLLAVFLERVLLR